MDSKLLDRIRSTLHPRKESRVNVAWMPDGGHVEKADMWKGSCFLTATSTPNKSFFFGRSRCQHVDRLLRDVRHFVEWDVSRKRFVQG